MNWIKTTDELPNLYAPVLSDTMFEGMLTPDGWEGISPPDKWAYVSTPYRDETQQSISEWGQHTFGKVKDPAVLVGRTFEEFSELLELLLPMEAAPRLKEVTDSLRARLRTPSTVLPASRNLEAEISDELADVMVVLLQAAESYGVDLLGAVDAKMVVNRARNWKTDMQGVGQHSD